MSAAGPWAWFRPRRSTSNISKKCRAIEAGLLLALAFALPAGAAPRKICGLPVTSNAALSPDGKTAAFIRYVRVLNADIPTGKEGNLWLRDCRTGNEHRLLPAPGRPNREGNIGWPVFSLDGRFIYASVWRGGNGTMVYRVDPVTRRYDVVFPAGVFGIIRTGPHRGDFLANNPTALYSGKGDTGHIGYPLYVFDPQGRVLRYIGGSQEWDGKRLRRWLKGQGWQVSWAGELAP